MKRKKSTSTQHAIAGLVYGLLAVFAAGYIASISPKKP